MRLAGITPLFALSPSTESGFQRESPAFQSERGATHPFALAFSSNWRRSARAALLVAVALTFAGCQQHGAYTVGTPEYAASVLSRGYDCGLRVERGRVVSRYHGDDRRRLIASNQTFAVRSYNLPRECSDAERTRVSDELRMIARQSVTRPAP